MKLQLSKRLNPILVVLLTLFSFPVKPVTAQGIDMEETLNFINTRLSPSSNIEVLRGVLIAKFYDGGEIIREDQVLCKDLNIASMSYDSGSKLFSINCNGTMKCVDRQLFIRKIQRDYNRISFPVNLDANGVESMKKAITHMIKLVLDPKYENSEPFD